MDADVTVVGAGIVGLATARAIQRRMGGEVLVIDKESAPGRHQSGRNSGVLHSGLYYSPGSLKARLVSSGRQMFIDRAKEWGVRVERCGKVVVATRERERTALDALERNAEARRIPVQRMTPAELRRVEPHVRGLSALHVPDAAVTDFPAACRRLADEIRDSGGSLHLGRAVEGVRRLPGGTALRLEGTWGSLSTRWLVNCAGLHSDRVARMAGCDTGVRIVPFRGEYHQLSPAARHLVRSLVYPVPDPRWPFLGVHFTAMLDGSVHVGPNALLALGREAYRGGIDRSELVDLVRTPGLGRLAGRYWRTGTTELLRSRSHRLLMADVRRLLPGVEARDLTTAESGIRAQAISADGRLLDDFAFGSSYRAVHVLNAPSPAATASLAIAEVVTDRLEAMLGD
jgi:(S)-2-hydroxyglutarate dehydrogenase